MNNIDLEAWVLRIVERVRAGQRQEDSRVELKREWPVPPGNAARQLAGHVNAIEADHVLWIIGLDEKSGAVVTPKPEDTATWRAQVQAEFDELPPALLQDLHVPVGAGEGVLALLFDASRAPYVTRSPPQNGLWIPWREGTSTRSAHRHELVSLLSSQGLAPSLHVREARAFWSAVDGSGRDVTLEAKVYVVPSSRDPLTIPFHECEATITGGGLVRHSARFVLWPPPASTLGRSAGVGTAGSLTMDVTQDEIHIAGPGAAMLRASFAVPREDKAPDRASVRVSLRPAGSRAGAVLDFELVLSSVNPDAMSWVGR